MDCPPSAMPNQITAYAARIFLNPLPLSSSWSAVTSVKVEHAGARGQDPVGGVVSRQGEGARLQRHIESERRLAAAKPRHRIGRPRVEASIQRDPAQPHQVGRFQQT